MVIAKSKTSITVAHYTKDQNISLDGGSVGKFKLQRFLLNAENNEKPCSILDFDRGVYHVVSQNSKTTRREHICRLLERLNETLYNVNVNNCEHIINYIMNGTQDVSGKEENRQGIEIPENAENPQDSPTKSRENKGTPTNDKDVQDQAEEKACFANCVNSAISDIKNFGLIHAFIISIIGAMVGSLMWNSRLKILTSAVLLLFRNETFLHENDTTSCTLTPFGKVTIEDVIRQLSETHSDLRHRNLFVASGVLNNISATMSSDYFICHTANYFANSIIRSTVFYIAGISITFEAIASSRYICFGLKSLREIISTKVINRLLIIQVCVIILTNALTGVVGWAILTFCEWNTLYVFYFVYIFGGVFLRFFITFATGCCLSQFSWLICNSECGATCSKGRHTKIMLIIQFIFAVVLMSLLFLVLIDKFL